MDQVVFWILIIILIICVSIIYKLLGSKKNILNVCQEFIRKLVNKSDYLILNADQVACLPDNFKKQSEYLLEEISENNSNVDIEKCMNENLSRRLLLLFYPKSSGEKFVIGLLKFYPLNSSPEIFERVSQKAKHNSIGNNPIYVSSVIIDQKYRGKGLGGQMFNILFHEIQKMYPKRNIILEVKKINDPAIKLYRKLGFNIIGQNEKEYLMKKFMT